MTPPNLVLSGHFTSTTSHCLLIRPTSVLLILGPFNTWIFLHSARLMSLLALPSEIWASYVVPLVDSPGMIRLMSCSRASKDLAHNALQRALFVVAMAPSDPLACLAWLRNTRISINQLVIGRDHQRALAEAKRLEFDACFREVALKISEESSDITGEQDNALLLLLHKKLISLEIDAPKEPPVNLMEKCLGCRSLHSITYTMFKRYADCDQTWLAQIIRASLGLRKLHIGQGTCFVDSVLSAVAERKDTLTDLTVCIGVSDIPDVDEHDQLRRILESCPSLRKLTFWMDEGIEAYGDGLVGMEGKCPHLEELVLHQMDFSGDSLLNFILSCPRLRVCRVDGNFIGNHDRIKDQDLEKWHRRGLPKLHDLRLGWAVERLETMVACAAQFEEVRTYHMNCFQHWETAAEALAYMPHLHTVCLYSHPVLLLPYLPRYCPQLRVLRFMQNGMPLYTGDVCEALVTALPSLPKLEVLQWRMASGFTETGLMALAQHCPNLRTLDCRSTDVTDAGLIALVRSCPDLRTLRLWHGREGQMTDAFLHAIAQHCPYLEDLGLPRWRWAPTLAAVTEVLAACAHLRVLHVPWQLKGGVQASALVVPVGRLRRLTIKIL